MGKMKGQKSLEMIVGLVILLVVAAVVINIFINYVSTEKLPVKPEDSLEAQNAETTCQNLCARYENTGKTVDAFEYCTKRFVPIDWNRNSKIDLTKIGVWDVCEDAVYCIHLKPCEWRTGALTMHDCQMIVCQQYLEKYAIEPNADELATQAMLDDMISGENGTVCSLPTGPDNWHTSYFDNGVPPAFACTPYVV